MNTNEFRHEISSKKARNIWEQIKHDFAYIPQGQKHRTNNENLPLIIIKAIININRLTDVNSKAIIT